MDIKIFNSLINKKIKNLKTFIFSVNITRLKTLNEYKNRIIKTLTEQNK